MDAVGIGGAVSTRTGGTTGFGRLVVDGANAAGIGAVVFGIVAATDVAAVVTGCVGAARIGLDTDATGVADVSAVADAKIGAKPLATGTGAGRSCSAAICAVATRSEDAPGRFPKATGGAAVVSAAASTGGRSAPYPSCGGAVGRASPRSTT